MPRIDLRFIPTNQLRAELARRSMTEAKVEPVVAQKWVCACGNTAHSGGDFKSVFVEFGNVWCRICIPSGHANLYGLYGPVISRPMQQVNA